MSLVTEYAHDGKQFIIYVSGHFDFSRVQEFRNAYEGMAPSVRQVIIDFRATEHIDSSGLGMLLNMRKSLAPEQRRFHLVNCTPTVRKVFDISRFDKLFVID